MDVYFTLDKPKASARPEIISQMPHHAAMMTMPPSPLKKLNQDQSLRTNVISYRSKSEGEIPNSFLKHLEKIRRVSETRLKSDFGYIIFLVNRSSLARCKAY